MTRRLDARPGTYALVLRVDRDRRIVVGSLGALDVSAGRYVYVGSAFGPGGVRARVVRHARGDGRRHWHVDHLRAIAALEEVWVSLGERRLECAWARDLADRPDADRPFAGFGSSDCPCETHLFFVEGGDPARIRDALGASSARVPRREGASR